MRVLLEFTTLNYKIWHSMAKHLLEICPESKFAGILNYGLGADHCLEYLKQQKDIEYEFLELWHEDRNKAFQADIDYALLKKFEENSPYKSLWRMVAADRNIGSKFMRDAVWVNSYLTEMSTRENVLRMCSGLIKKMTALFDQFKPDVFLPSPNMTSIEVYITEQLCKERNIDYAVPATCRIEDIFSFTDSKYPQFPQIIRLYKKLIDGKVDLDFKKGEDLYNKIVAEFKESQFFDRKNECFSIKKISTLPDKFKFHLGTLRSCARICVQWAAEMRFRQSDDVRRQLNNWKAFWGNLSFVLHLRYHKYFHLLNPEFGQLPQPGEKYLYYPLHINPEVSTQIYGTMWLNQLHLIESLAKSIPSDWIIYVKEHPATQMYRTRPLNFYEQIQRIPNVRIAPINTDMHELIANAQMVAVITGTTGWEAILRGVPVINFGECFFEALGLSRKCSNLSTLSVDIYNEILRMKNFSLEERNRRIVCYLTAILERGFRITYAQQFANNAPGADEQFDHIGAELAQELVKYLDLLKREKEEAGDLFPASQRP